LHVVSDVSVLSLTEIREDGEALFGAVLADVTDRGEARADSRIMELLARC